MVDIGADSKMGAYLLHGRNREWVPFMERLHREAGRAAFFMVGAAHLVGPTGLIALLEARGFTSRRISVGGAAHLAPRRSLGATGSGLSAFSR